MERSRRAPARVLRRILFSAQRDGEILEILPYVKHTLYRRIAPFKGFTIRVPLELDDKIEFES